MARLTRQELKKDELAERLRSIRDFLFQNQQKIAQVSVITVVVFGVIVGAFLYVRNRQTQGSDALAQAMTTFHAAVAEAPPPNVNPATLRFKTANEKNQQALQEFTAVAGRYSWYSQGKLARYYAALCERELGKFSEAENDLTAIASERNRDLGALAKMALAGIDEQTGRTGQAEKIYRDLEDHPASTVPRATVELALAELYQKTKPAEATALYKKIETNYPGSAAGDQASKMLQSQTR